MLERPRELDVVRLKSSAGHFAAGTVGTVVHVSATKALVEVVVGERLAGMLPTADFVDDQVSVSLNDLTIVEHASRHATSA